MPSDLEFTVLEAGASVLKLHYVLHVFIDGLAGEKYITISAIHPLLRHIVEEVLLVGADDYAITVHNIMGCRLYQNVTKSRYL